MQQGGIQVDHLVVERDGRRIVDDVSLNCAAGEILALLGPNGAGKTTVMKAMLGLIPAQSGRITIDGHSLDDLSSIERAQKIAYVPQSSQLTARLLGRDVVAQARYAHRNQAGGDPRHDAIITDALTRTDCLNLAERPFSVCSGGERARILLARALATEADFLLLDEPTAALDVNHTLHFYELLSGLAAAGKGIVIVLHEIGDALRFAHQAVVMQAGCAVAHGALETVLSEALVRRTFGVQLHHDGIRFSLPESGVQA